jgi:hypothetical protein
MHGQPKRFTDCKDFLERRGLVQGAAHIVSGGGKRIDQAPPLTTCAALWEHGLPFTPDKVSHRAAEASRFGARLACYFPNLFGARLLPLSGRPRQLAF